MKYIIDTLGCKVNQFETAALDRLLADEGFIKACKGEAPDIFIINSCAVTAESVRKSSQAFRRIKKKYPDSVSVLTGCFPQTEPKRAEALGADIVCGTSERGRIPGLIAQFLENRTRQTLIAKLGEKREIEELPAEGYDSHARAYLKVEDGCQNFCTYCIIPFARGPVRSLEPEKAAKAAAELYGKGYLELVLTGIELSSYGQDLKPQRSLTELISEIFKAAPELRLRIGSLEASIIDEEFCKNLSEIPSLCDHFHLSLQSGSNSVLQAMGRKYSAERFYESVEILRKYFPNAALTADLICGFPGEGEKEHEETLNFIKKCKFYDMHIFPYSKRKYTKAEKMPGQNTKAEKVRRVREARALADEMKAEYLNAQIGRDSEVVFETEECGFSLGHSSNYCLVEVKASDLRHSCRNVHIQSVSGDKLCGILL